jgi:3'(2'), 5'-bisphosphate nucleotidase
MRVDSDDPDSIGVQLADIALEAGAMLRGLESSVSGHSIKADGTPTTAADLAAEKFIIERLEQRWPGIPTIAEETTNAISPDAFFFLVDPLDGTSDFLRGTGEYTVNIALIAGKRPIAGVVAAPAIGRIWIGGRKAQVGEVAASAATVSWRPAQVRAAPMGSLVALVSRRHGDELTEACLATLSIGTRRTASSALKFCLIASGEADVYVRCGPTMEWDTAAGDHILTCAGGGVIGPGGAVLTYGHEDRGYRNGPFAAIGDAAVARRLSLPFAPAA